MSTLELKIPPLALTILVGVAMWLAATQWPALAFALPGSTAIALALGAAGGGLAVAGVLTFGKAMTTRNPMRPDSASALVTVGVYRLSRNPMYVGILFALAGWAVFLSNGLAVLFLPMFVVYMNRFQIAPEERALSAKFGADYAEYMRSVRRWL